MSENVNNPDAEVLPNANRLLSLEEREQEYQRLNAQLEAQTAKLVLEADEVMKHQDDFLQSVSPEFDDVGAVDTVVPPLITPSGKKEKTCFVLMVELYNKTIDITNLTTLSVCILARTIFHAGHEFAHRKFALPNER